MSWRSLFGLTVCCVANDQYLIREHSREWEHEWTDYVTESEQKGLGRGIHVMQRTKLPRYGGGGYSMCSC